MSHKLISHSPDLKKLVDEGFEVEVRAGYLLIHHVPYVNSGREIRYGTLASDLATAGERTGPPRPHLAYFVGEHPCNTDGSEIAQIKHGTVNIDLGGGLVANYSFSHKRDGRDYVDYYEKMTTYILAIESPAKAMDPRLTAQTHRPIETKDEDSVFVYMDTASSRANITAISEKLALSKIAIVGVGGTGSYVLDLVSKTPVKEIHLFDGDDFLSHNAFRAPGAAALEDWDKGAPKKVDYLRARYSKMHKGIVPHPYHIDECNVDELRAMNFVFICMDGGNVKRLVVEVLESAGIAFIDVGMDVQIGESALTGVARVTASTADKRDHFRLEVAFGDGGWNDDYSTNIQIADLNALNAALAVIKWKKLCGFYHDFSNEYSSTYMIEGNMVTNGHCDAP
jgi:hypothetical protein